MTPAPVLRDRRLVPLGVLMCAVAVLGLVLAVTAGVAASTVVGIGAGLLLLVFGRHAVASAVPTPPGRP